MLWRASRWTLIDKVTALMPVSKDLVIHRRLSVQETSQRLALVVLDLLDHARIRRKVEAVRRPQIYVELDRHVGAA
jgi:hypothetical protein